MDLLDTAAALRTANPESDPADIAGLASAAAAGDELAELDFYDTRV